MICETPFYQGMYPRPCGKCEPCAFNARRVWLGRLLLESKEHKDSCFVTLTYDNSKVFGPCGPGLSSVALRLFIKRVRKGLGDGIRYYGCGEYGDESARPHYHVVLFGVSAVREHNIRKAWPFGYVSAFPLVVERLAYVCGYVAKKYKRKLGEFSVMSQGLGRGFVDRYVSAMKGVTELPMMFRTDGTKFPVGRYLKNKIFDKIGLGQDDRDSQNAKYDYKYWHDRIDRDVKQLEIERRCRLEVQRGKLSIKKGGSI